MVRLRSVARISAALGVVLAGFLAGPYMLDVVNGFKHRSPNRFQSRDAYAERFRFEQRMVQMDKDPLAWDCHTGSPDRVRYYRDSCFAEYVAEFNLAPPPSQGNVQLMARDQAVFTDESGTPLLGIHVITPLQANSLRSFLQSALPKLPPAVDNWQMPPYTSAIEACIDGVPFISIRSISNDESFESVASELVSRAGVVISRKSPGSCM